MPGAVQLSDAAWDALRLPAGADTDAALPAEEERDIKGKGRMRTRTVAAGSAAAARLRALVDAPWPDSPPPQKGLAPESGKPPRSASQRTLAC